MNTQARDHVLSDFERVFLALPGAGVPWLSCARRTALARFAASGFPGTTDEEWKYTSVAAIEKNAFKAASGRENSDPALAARVHELALGSEPGQGLPHLLVFIDGRHSPSLSQPGRLPSGATLDSLGERIATAPAALEEYFQGADEQTVFGHLNTAFMADGAYLHLARGTVVEQPIHLLFIATDRSVVGGDASASAGFSAGLSTGFAFSPHNLIVAEEGAQATVIEHYVGAETALYLTNALTRIFAAADSKIAHYKLQQESPKAFHVAGIHALQGAGSEFTSHSVSLGALLARNDISSVFAGPGCATTMDGLYLVGGRQHVDNHTRIDHREARGSSREFYRGVLDGRARAVFNGKVIVHPGAQKTDARQANHNLLLSDDAEIDSKPQLEIYADDVQCTHAATIGQIDENQLFYLRARGIEEMMARSLLVHAFANDVVERIRVAALRSRLEHILFSRLPQGERIRELA